MKQFCLDCKEEIIPDKNHPFQKFCSKGCRELNIKKNNKCIDCGESLNSRAKYAKTKRCRKCENLFKKGKSPKDGFKLGENKGKNNINYKHGKYTVSYYCIDCKKEISDASFIYGKSRCSKCYGLSKIGIELSKEQKQKISLGNTGKKRSDDAKLKYSLSKIGNKNPAFNNWSSREPYASEWSIELREQIRRRDNYECQNCGMTEEEHLIVIGKSLSVHHIDYNKKNCSQYNLITTCNQCNCRANHNRYYWLEFYENKIAQLNKEASKNESLQK